MQRAVAAAAARCRPSAAAALLNAPSMVAQPRAVAARSSSSNSTSSSSGQAASAQPQQQLLLPPELADFRPNVGICVVNRDGKVWAAQRLDDPVPDSWQMPQGGIDPGETPEQAAVRELFEETSMRSVELVGEIDEWLPYEFPTEVRCSFTGEWARFKGQAQRWFLFVYRGRGDGEIDLDTAHREFKAWRWMDIDELPPRVIAFKRGVYERVAAEFGPRIEALRAAGDLLGVAD